MADVTEQNAEQRTTGAQAQTGQAQGEPATPRPAQLARAVVVSAGHFCVVALLYAFFLSWRQGRAFPDVLSQMTVTTLGSGFVSVPALLVVIALAGLIDYACMLAHEGGHVLACFVLQGWFFSLRVGVVTFTRTRGGLRLGFSPERAAGGAVVSYLTGERFLRLRDALLASGGPCASLLLGALVWWLAGRVSVGESDDASLLAPSSLLAFVAAYSALNGVGNLLPLKGNGGQFSDGLRMLQPLLRPARAGRDAALSVLMGCLLRRIPAAEWPVAVVRQAARLFDGGSAMDVLAAILAYSRASDVGDIPTARWYLYRSLAASPGRAAYLPGLALEAAYFMARHDRQPGVARTWLPHGAGAQYEAVLRLRAEAAILLAEGQLGEAHARATAGLAAVLRAKPSSLVSLDEEERDLRELQALAAAVPYQALPAQGRNPQ
jgi:hypothetical protein